jgi:multidrug transporter EmrE-like cation transporter
MNNLYNYLYIIAYVLIIVIIECFAQICLKKYSNEKSIHLLLIGAFIYAIIAYLLVLSFSFEKMAIINVLWGGISAIFLTLMAYYLYNEKINSYQLLGIIIVLIGTTIIKLGADNY